MVQSIEVLSVLKTLSSISCVISVLAAKVDLITIIEKAITSISTLALAVIAIIGYFSWKKQIKWKKKIEVLYDTFVQLGKIKDIIQWIRQPLFLRTYDKCREVKPDEGEEEKELKNISFNVYERCNKYIDEFGNFNSLKYKLRIFYPDFDPEFEKKVFDEINKIRGNILGAADVLRDKAENINKGDKENNRKIIENCLKVIEGVRDDEIDKKINIIISIVEAEYRKEEK